MAFAHKEGLHGLQGGADAEGRTVELVKAGDILAIRTVSCRKT